MRAMERTAVVFLAAIVCINKIHLVSANQLSLSGSESECGKDVSGFEAYTHYTTSTIFELSWNAKKAPINKVDIPCIKTTETLYILVPVVDFMGGPIHLKPGIRKAVLWNIGTSFFIPNQLQYTLVKLEPGINNTPTTDVFLFKSGGGDHVVVAIFTPVQHKDYRKLVKDNPVFDVVEYFSFDQIPKDESPVLLISQRSPKITANLGATSLSGSGSECGNNVSGISAYTHYSTSTIFELSWNAKKAPINKVDIPCTKTTETLYILVPVVDFMGGPIHLKPGIRKAVLWNIGTSVFIPNQLQYTLVALDPGINNTPTTDVFLFKSGGGDHVVVAVFTPVQHKDYQKLLKDNPVFDVVEYSSFKQIPKDESQVLLISQRSSNITANQGTKKTTSTPVTTNAPVAVAPVTPKAQLSNSTSGKPEEKPVCISPSDFCPRDGCCTERVDELTAKLTNMKLRVFELECKAAGYDILQKKMTRREADIAMLKKKVAKLEHLMAARP